MSKLEETGSARIGVSTRTRGSSAANASASRSDSPVQESVRIVCRDLGELKKLTSTIHRRLDSRSPEAFIWTPSGVIIGVPVESGLKRTLRRAVANAMLESPETVKPFRPCCGDVRGLEWSRTNDAA